MPCRTNRVTEAMHFKTNNGAHFQNHEVILSVRISSVICQAAALKNNHASALIYYLCLQQCSEAQQDGGFLVPEAAPTLKAWMAVCSCFLQMWLEAQSWG